ncbi:MAG: 3'-5' exonuclease [Eubacteriales bacterium]|nr:3'-5' exonuclease [Eubacteriales bacterium]
MRLIVFDLEWNTLCPSYLLQGRDPAALVKRRLRNCHLENQVKNPMQKLTAEIIEIGACRIDLTGAPRAQYQSRIYPVRHSILNPYVAKTIHLKQSQLEEGRAFPTVYDEFIRWCRAGLAEDEPLILIAWSTSDALALKANLDYFGLPTKLPFRMLDLQALYAYSLRSKHRSRLQKAIVELGLAQTRPFHDALDDALYTAEVYRALVPIYGAAFLQREQSLDSIGNLNSFVASELFKDLPTTGSEGGSLGDAAEAEIIGENSIRPRRSSRSAQKRWRRAQQDCEGLLAKQGLSKQAAEELLEAAILKLAFDATVSVSTKISVRADLSDENTFSAQFLQNFKCPNCQRRLEVLEPLALAANTQFKGFYDCPEHGRFVLHFHLHGAPRRSGREQAKPQQRFMRRLPPLKPKPARGQVYGLTLKFVHDEGWASQGVD